MNYELIGYLASVLVAVSLMMSSLLKLRVINLGGAICFTVYGFVIHAYPVAAVNLFIVFINAYYLIEIFTAKEYFTVLETAHDSEYLQRFLGFYEKEIARFLPEFAFVPAEKQMIFFVLRNLVPAGVFIVEARPDGALFIALDFVIPGYRDFKIGQFLFAASAGLFEAKGFQKLYSLPGNPAHEKYLRRMGFAPVTLPDQRRYYAKDL